MTSHETAKIPGGSPANVHFRALRPDPAAASFTLWRPLAAGFTSRKRKLNMPHFHGHQSAAAVPGKLHNDVDIANWLCRKKNNVLSGRETFTQETTDYLSVHLCAWGNDPFLIWIGGGLRPESISPARGTCSPLCPRAAQEQESIFLSIVVMGSSTTSHHSEEELHMPCWAFCSCQEESSESRRP